MDADGVKIPERQQTRAEGAEDEWRFATNPVRKIAHDGDDQDSQDVPQNRDPQIDVLREPNAVGGLDRIRGAENGGDYRYDIHEGHADNAEHIRPTGLEGFDNGRPGYRAMPALRGERRRLIHLAADDIACNDDDEAEDKGNTPTPGIESLFRHVRSERQEYSSGQDLTGLYALQRKAGKETAPTEWRMLQDHRTGPRDLTGDGEALDQSQNDEENWCEDSNLRIRGEKPHSHCGETHEEHAQDQHIFSSVRIAPMPQDEGPNGSTYVSHPIGRKRRDDGNCWIA